VTTSNIDRRLGRFFISSQILREQPESLRTLFAKMIVVEAQMRWERDSVEYLAMSDRFEPVEEGVMCPIYDIIFKYDSEGVATFHKVVQQP
tara:strand:- start:104 stop:376 length:273 start_codon:yes stop_codon:yes gene_type:complete